MSDTRLTLRVDFGANRSIGPGKVRLLEAIDKTGSISQAGRALGMSYRRAWLLIDDMNQCFNHAVTTARPGTHSDRRRSTRLPYLSASVGPASRCAKKISCSDRNCKWPVRCLPHACHSIMAPA